MNTLLSVRRVVVTAWIILLGSLQAYTVIIDPGHGGRDPGAVRPGAYEKALTLSTSHMLAQELRRLGIPYVMTRSHDEARSLTSRRDLAKRYPNAVFVSIHYNAAVNTNARGVETFYHSASSRALGTNVQRALTYLTGATDRGLKQRGLKVLAKNPARASILVEGGFLSNAWERQRCQDPRYQLAVAQAVVTGLVETFGRPEPRGQWASHARSARSAPRSGWPKEVTLATFSRHRGWKR